MRISRRVTHVIVVGAIALVVLIADQITKTLAVDHLVNGPVHVIGPFSFELGYNSGVAFSLGTGVGGPLIVVVIAVLVGLIFFVRSIPTLPGAIALGLVLGGSLGNLWDRIFRANAGAVIDFIHTGFWPTFNVADAAVVCGCIVLALVFLRRSNAVERSTSSTAPPFGEGRD